MRVRDTYDVLASCLAVAGDALAVFAGFMLATWIRFESGWIPLFHDKPPAQLYTMYTGGAVVTTMVMLFAFQSLKLYVRPQIGDFAGRIPRLIRGVITGIVIAIALTFMVRTKPEFARMVAFLAIPTISLTVLVERWLLFHWEIRLARQRRTVNRVILIGADALAARLRTALQSEPRLRSQVVACLKIGEGGNPSRHPPDLVKGTLDETRGFLESHLADQVILTDTSIGQNRMLELLLLCEQNMVAFNIVPDLFRIMTNSVDLQTIDDIPLLGVSRWPLDRFWNRLLKRLEDVAGAALGLALYRAALMLLIAAAIRRDSRGPVLFRQNAARRAGALPAFTSSAPCARTPSRPPARSGPWPTTLPRIGAWLRRVSEQPGRTAAVMERAQG